MKMAKIVCVPVCSKCHSIIWDTVYHDLNGIMPRFCKVCGEYFDSIVIPKPDHFPIETVDLLEKEITYNDQTYLVQCMRGEKPASV